MKEYNRITKLRTFTINIKVLNAFDLLAKKESINKSKLVSKLIEDWVLSQENN